MKKYFEYFARKPGLKLVSVLILVLLGAALFLGVLSHQEMQRVVNEGFNAQQLALAKHAAGIFTQSVKFLKRELITLSLSPSIQYIEAVSWANRMKISLSSTRDQGVIQLMLIDADGTRSYSINYANSVFIESKPYGDQDYFKWCQKPENKDLIYMSDVGKGAVQNSEPGLVMTMATPVYQVSSDEAHPKPTYRFNGVLAFVIDVGSLAKRYVGSIRSGKTGYGWVIDESGNFLYHLEKDFVGQNAFEVRRFKAENISFSKINVIQKTEMLQGEEGTSWYVSGWHRGVKGEMKKLIAYAPVQLGSANATRTWSVAVVAPISEVEDAVHALYVRQSLIQGSFTAAVLVIFTFLIANERAWLKTLEFRVKETTKDLADYAQRLRRSEERYRSLVESAEDMIYTVDKDCKILSVNEYSKRLFGQDPAGLIGKSLTDVIQYEDPESVCLIIKRVLETSRTSAREERARIGNKDYWLDTKYKAVGRDQYGEDTVLVISRDITEHKVIEEQLFHTEKLASLGSLSAGVAHEINNPIAIILGFTELLLARFPEGSREHEILRTIERQGGNCKRIIENLLAFARIRKETSVETDVVNDLKRVLNMVRNTLITKNVDLKVDIDEDLPKVKGDGQELEQVFLNIINNAIGAMNGGGILTILAHRSDGAVRVCFTDTGEGISPDIRAKIFEPFFTTKKVGEGTGLGLSVSYGIVKKFGGDIQVKSQTRGEGKEPGTTFTILLPVANDEADESTSVDLAADTREPDNA